MSDYKIIEVVSPSDLTKKVFKFGHSAAWVSTWERDYYNSPEWGKLSETKYPIYVATMLLNQLRKDGWK